VTALVPGSLTPDAVDRTVQSIVDVQLPDGQIPWFPGGRTDPWDHIEAAMALSAGGRFDEARAGYEWLRATQNPDGSWYRGYQGAEVVDPVREANFSAYLTVGLLHHLRSTGDESFVDEMWPTVMRALEFVLGLQDPDGPIRWARSPDGTVADEALLTGCSSMFHSLRCGLELARVRGEPQPDWELAASSLGHAIAAHEDLFAPRDRFSMDWYYPVLGGALRGSAAHERLAAGWDRFVVPGLGIRCVSDRPWVTGAETCELVLALCAVGDRDRAATLFADMQHLRDPDGSYWTGYVYPDDARWPEEQTTWTSAAVVLAAAMLAGDPVTTFVFDGADLPVCATDIDLDCAVHLRTA
jgi:hypothetical protein